MKEDLKYIHEKFPQELFDELVNYAKILKRKDTFAPSFEEIAQLTTEIREIALVRQRVAEVEIECDIAFITLDRLLKNLIRKNNDAYLKCKNKEEREAFLYKASKALMLLRAKIHALQKVCDKLNSLFKANSIALQGNRNAYMDIFRGGKEE